MNRRLKMTVAVAALQLFAAPPSAGAVATRGPGPSVRRSMMTQGGSKKVRRRAPEALAPGVWVGGSLLKLTVTRAGTRKLLGTFNLARDREPVLVKCR